MRFMKLGDGEIGYKVIIKSPRKQEDPIESYFPPVIWKAGKRVVYVCTTDHLVDVLLFSLCESGCRVFIQERTDAGLVWDECCIQHALDSIENSFSDEHEIEDYRRRYEKYCSRRQQVLSDSPKPEGQHMEVTP